MRSAGVDARMITVVVHPGRQFLEQRPERGDPHPGTDQDNRSVERA